MGIEVRVRSPEFGIRNSESAIRSAQSAIRSAQSAIRNPLSSFPGLQYTASSASDVVRGTRGESGDFAMPDPIVMTEATGLAFVIAALSLAALAWCGRRRPSGPAWADVGWVVGV